MFGSINIKEENPNKMKKAEDPSDWKELLTPEYNEENSQYMLKCWQSYERSTPICSQTSNMNLWDGESENLTEPKHLCHSFSLIHISPRTEANKGELVKKKWDVNDVDVRDSVIYRNSMLDSTRGSNIEIEEAEISLPPLEPPEVSVSNLNLPSQREIHYPQSLRRYTLWETLNQSISIPPSPSPNQSGTISLLINRKLYEYRDPVKTIEAVTEYLCRCLSTEPTYIQLYDNKWELVTATRGRILDSGIIYIGVPIYISPHFHNVTHLKDKNFKFPIQTKAQFMMQRIRDALEAKEKENKHFH